MRISIAASSRGGLTRIALLEGDGLREFFVADPAAPDGIGDVFAGRVAARVPAMAGSFVDLGGGKTGFLPDSFGPKNLSEGAYLTVVVTRSAQGGKGVRLAALPEPPGDKVGMVRPGPGPLRELAERFPAAGIVADDYGLIAAHRPALEGRMAWRAEAFDAVLEDEIAALAEPSAPLGQGAVMHVGVTQALTTIDIDAGAATAAAGAKAPSQLALNIGIMPELVRQIILRNLSGGILVDFAGMKSAARAKLAAPLTKALLRDPLRARFLGFSHLGYAELTRPRLRPPLHGLLTP
jgi:Ribonuclease G/E